MPFSLEPRGLHQPKPGCVSLVFLVRAIFQVARMIVLVIAVHVIHFATRWAITKKGTGYQPVNRYAA